MEKVKKENYKIVLKYLLFLALFFILSFAEINFAIKPFLVAFLFSLVWCNQNPLIISLMYVGVNLIVNPFSVGLLVSSVFCCFVLISLYYIHKKFKKPINRYIYLLYCLFSQIAFLYYSFTTPESLINAIISVFVSLILLICYNIFFSSVFVKGFSSVFTINEIFSCCVFLISLSVGISSFNVFGIEFIKVFAVFLILLSLFTLGGKSSFVVAISVGIGSALQSYSLTLIAVFCIFSGLALCFEKSNKYFASLAILLIDIFLGLYLKIYEVYNIYSVISIVLGCLAFIVIPKQYLNNIKEIFGSFNSSLLYRNLINSTKDSMVRRLSEISEVFLDMEINFKNMVKGNLPKEEAKQLLINELCSKVCSDCKEKHKCLRQEGQEAMKAFDMMLNKGFEKGKVTLLDIPVALSGRCNRSANIISALNGLINSYKQYSFMISSQDTSKILIGEQMGGVSKLLKGLIDDTSNNFNFDLTQETTIKEELKFLHINCSDVISFVKDGFYNMTLVIRKTDYNKQEIEKLISKIVKANMKITSENSLNSNFDVIQIKNAPHYDAIFGVSGITKDNSEISGDTYSFIKIDDDKILIAVSDGMGSGENAQHLSEVSLNLIENFYKAGFENEIILNSVNKLLTINSEECFSALDICVVDLKKELIDFIKLGAPVGFVKKDNDTEIIESGSLPIGILEEISPVVTKKIITGNEILILVSDGVIESFRGEENLKNYINSLSLLNPQQISEEIINNCKQNEILDDCTCIALRIFEIVE